MFHLISFFYPKSTTRALHKGRVHICSLYCLLSCASGSEESKTQTVKMNCFILRHCKCSKAAGIKIKKKRPSEKAYFRCLKDFRSCAAPLRVRNAVQYELVVLSADTSQHLTWPEVLSNKFFTESTLAYQSPHPNTVAGLVFHEASSKIVTAAVDPLVVLVTQASELSGFFGTLQVGSNAKIFFVGDVRQHRVERHRPGSFRRPACMVSQHHFLHGWVVREGHIRR